MKILFLTYHWGTNTHHSAYSGYQQIINYAAKNNECTVVTWGNENTIKIENGIEVHYIKPFMKKDYFFIKRLAISKYAKKIENQFDIVHALYTYCGYFQNHSNLFVTFHNSPFVDKGSYFLSKIFVTLRYFLIERKVLNKSKKIFIVSKNLKLGLKKYSNKLVFIPHGINTDFWKPSILRSIEFQDFDAKLPFILFVGNNGVNKSLLFETIKDNIDIKFVVVGLRNFNCEYKNVIRLDHLSDDVLKYLYLNCLLFIRPMNFATANNSILEALSMGKNIVISTPDGKYDYVYDECNFIHVVKNVNFSQYIKELLHTLKSESINNTDAVRKYAINNFDWEVILSKTMKYYE